MATSHGNGEGPGPSSFETASSHHEPIAVVGIGCRFPGRANDPETFWRLLEAGVDAVTEIPARPLEPSRPFTTPIPSRPGKTYSRWGGFVEEIDRFDPHFFGISPQGSGPHGPAAAPPARSGLGGAGGRRAAPRSDLRQPDGRLRRDLQLRLLAAGKRAFATAARSTRIRTRADRFPSRRTGSRIASTSAGRARPSTRPARRRWWRSTWPAGASGEDGCPLALAGGVNVLLLPDWYVGFCRMGMLSPEGRCRAFDAGASGFVRSEGAGMVVLKPLAQALADGDRVYAIIRGTAMNQDGRTPGMTVPSQEAQEALLRAGVPRRRRRAGVDPVRRGPRHRHPRGRPDRGPGPGTGPVRWPARAIEPCLIGSVKTNIGHLEAGAGIAGLIKVALALYHRRIPGNLHFDRPNPEIDFGALRLRVPTHCEPWPAADGPALAGVNAFGFGGTNAHVVLQEALRSRDARCFPERHDGDELVDAPVATSSTWRS